MHLLAALAATAAAWDERGPDAVPTGRTVDAAARFVPGDPGWDRPGLLPETASTEIGAVARETARELREQRAAGTVLADAGLFAELGVSLDDVDLVDRTAREDRGAVHKRLEDPAWLAAHFDAWLWRSDTEGAAARDIALEPEQIRLTSYLVYQVEGRTARDADHDTPLYALPDAELAGAPPDLRLKYDRPAVYAGVYLDGEAAGAARPLVWLTRADANQAQLQGSVEVRTEDGRTRMYNVHENNGIPYDPAIRDGDRQRRFWYFREVQGILGIEQIPLRPRAAVAGDVYDLGLGKLVALRWDGERGPEVHLAVLADTGGAFQPNLFQLDWLAGAFPSAAAYQAWAATVPKRVEAAVLVRRAP
ncbi:MAG: MltA domain-containing protein [Myxococcota bacterium]